MTKHFLFLQSVSGKEDRLSTPYIAYAFLHVIIPGENSSNNNKNQTNKQTRYPPPKLNQTNQTPLALSPPTPIILQLGTETLYFSAYVNKTTFCPVTSFLSRKDCSQNFCSVLSNNTIFIKSSNLLYAWSSFLTEDELSIAIPMGNAQMQSSMYHHYFLPTNNVLQLH